MSSTKAEPGPFDAFDKAHDNEPIFVLLGRDQAAPGAITEWCRIRRNMALKTFAPDSDEFKGELRQCADAEAIGYSMIDYRKGEEAVEEPVTEKVQNYSGVMGETQEQRDRNIKVADLVSHLRNANYHMAEAQTLLEELGITTAAIHTMLGKPGIPILDLFDAREIVNDIDRAIAPKRRETQPELPMPEPIQPSFAAECNHDWQNQAAEGSYGCLIDKCSKCGEERA